MGTSTAHAVRIGVALMTVALVATGCTTAKAASPQATPTPKEELAALGFTNAQPGTDQHFSWTSQIDHCTLGLEKTGASWTGYIWIPVSYGNYRLANIPDVTLQRITAKPDLQYCFETEATGPTYDI